MKRFTFRSWIYNLFDKHDSRKKSDELAQPKGEVNTSANASSKKDDSKKKTLWKKLGIWALIVSILGAIIAIIAVYATRKTEIKLTDPTVSYTLDSKAKTAPGQLPLVSAGNITTKPITISSGVLDFTDRVTGEQYSVDLSATNPNGALLAAYYRGTSNQISLKLQPKAGLPIVVNVDRTVLPSDNSLMVYHIGQSRIIVQMTDKGPIITSTNIENASVSALNEQLSPLIHILTSAYNNATYAPAGFNWWALFSTLVPIIILILIFWMSNSMMKKQMGGQDSIFGMGKTNLKPTKTKVRFSDVAGIDEVETELREIVDYVKNPKKYAAMGARAPKGIMLYGPPGTGKTLISKAVAGEANCSFYAISGSAFEDMLVGVGAKRVKDLFSKARKDAPSIIFIDEIDSVASKRGKNDIIGGGGGVADQTINQLLTEMDGFSTDSGVVVIAATNRLEALDEAILRPGRFDRQIQVTLPDIKGREAILKIHARNKNLSSKVNLRDIARRTAGFSGAQLENVMNEAALLAVRNNQTVITTNDLDEGIDRTIGGPARKGRAINEEERRQIAYHEAGHALVGLHSKNTDVVQKITIIPRGNAAGYTMQTPANQEMSIQRKVDLLNQVRMTLGGRAAEEIIFGKDAITTGASNDLYKVSQIVRAMVLQLGMTSKMGLTQYVPSEGQQPYQKLYSEQTAREADETIEAIIQKEYQNAKDIILTNRKELDLIVETLLVLETIVKEQIDYIHENLKLPPEVLNSNTSKLNDKSSDENDKDSSGTDSNESNDEQSPKNDDNNNGPNNNPVDSNL
ncbi:ATP-dependent zinc metalloprotease FtsH [Ureaplasma ceti]|uniref:ATP-dependent zinc metalloprotease FtsH n=1 Tax=Ureaplasma ceti TaxID=3119530 RepID=A0ABP9UAM9_9BACT